MLTYVKIQNTLHRCALRAIGVNCIVHILTYQRYTHSCIKYTGARCAAGHRRERAGHPQPQGVACGAAQGPAQRTQGPDAAGQPGGALPAGGEVLRQLAVPAGGLGGGSWLCFLLWILVVCARRLGWY